MSKRTQQVRNPKARPAPVHSSSDAPSFPLLWLAGILLLTGIVFWPMLHNQLTNWDDEAYVLSNTLLKGPDWKGIFMQPVVSNYHPLTVLSLALNYQISGLKPFSYLLFNWLLHLANTGLVFYLAWVMSGRVRWVALFTALVFALHPLHVESVAWVSERKDVLYTLFYLLALLQYWRYLEHSSLQRYGLTLLFFILSLLSKPAAVVLPLTLLLLDYWYGRPMDRKAWLEKIPFFALSLLMGILTVLIQSEKAIASLEKYTLADRFFFGCYGLVMYLWRFIWPAPLSAFHPYPQPGALGWFIQVAPVILLALVGTVWYFRREKALVFGALFYAANILLVVQFVAIGNTLLSERYTYVPYIGLAFGGAMWWAQRTDSAKPTALQWGLVGLVAVLFGYLSRRQTQVWRNSETLWSQAIEHFPDASIPRSNRANYRYQQSQLPANAARSGALMDQALADCDAALATTPSHFASLDIRSIIYLRKGLYDAALADANTMIAAKPDDKKGYIVRGSAYSFLRKFDAALADYNKILDLDPNNAEALNGRGTVLFNSQQRYREALADFDKAIAIQPQGSYYLNRSRCYLMLGDKEKARGEAALARQAGTPVPKDYQEALDR